jgi:hypothetical protein
VTALTKIVDHILKEMDQGNYTGVLFLDFKKAFDMVNHTILLSKLKVYTKLFCDACSRNLCAASNSF